MGEGEPEPDDGQRDQEDERLDGVRAGAAKVPADQRAGGDDERELDLERSRLPPRVVSSWLSR